MNQQLSPLEGEVMQVIWDKRSVSARDVLAALGGSSRFAYTTIATILQRLYMKKMVTRESVHGVNVYAPLISKEAYSGNLASNFISKFIKSYGDIGVVSFAKGLENLTDEQRKNLLTLLEDDKK